jgi:molybdopterin-binding protein
MVSLPVPEGLPSSLLLCTASAGQTCGNIVLDEPGILILEGKERYLMTLQFSARNRLKAVVKTLKFGDVMAEVTVTLPDGQEVVATITRTSAEALQLKPGDNVVAVIKSTEVMIGKEL